VDLPHGDDSGRRQPRDERRREPRIQANGLEYLVTINGSVFVALSLAQAEAIAYRAGRMPRDTERSSRASAPRGGP